MAKGTETMEVFPKSFLPKAKFKAYFAAVIPVIG